MGTGPRERPLIKELDALLKKITDKNTGDHAFFNHETKISLWLQVPLNFIQYFAKYFTKTSGTTILSYSYDSQYFSIGVEKSEVQIFTKQLEKFVKKLREKKLI